MPTMRLAVPGRLHDGYTRISKGTYRYTVTAIEPQRMTVHVTHDGEPAGTQMFTRDWNVIELVRFERGDAGSKP